MPKKCCFAFCHNHQLKKISGRDHIQFHSFPLNRPEILHKWLSAMNQLDLIPTLAHRLCSDHFSEDCYKKSPGSRKLLNSDAVPSIFYFSGPIKSKLMSRRLKRPYRKQIKRIKSEPNEVDASSSVENRFSNEEVTGSCCHSENFVDDIKPELNETPFENITFDKNSVNEEPDNNSHKLNVNIEGQSSGSNSRISNRSGRKPCTFCCAENGKQSSNKVEYEILPGESIENKVVKTKINSFEKKHPNALKTPYSLLESYKEASRSKLRVLRRKLKILQFRVKRRDKRIGVLQSLLDDMKKKLKQYSRGEQLITGLEGFAHDLLSHNIRNKDVKKNAVRYSPEMKEFAITLFYHSSKAYDYVRSRLQLLPNPSLIKKWIAILNKPSIEEQAAESIGIINDIGEELIIIDNINDFIIIDQPIEGCKETLT